VKINDIYTTTFRHISLSLSPKNSHKMAILKISLFVWCLLQNHIPIIFCGETYFKINNNFVWVVVDLMRISITWFYNGWVRLRCFLLSSQIIYINLVI